MTTPDALANRTRRLTYLNVILTVNAALLLLLIVQNAGVLTVPSVHAQSGPMAVSIEKVAAPIPVIIKGPLGVSTDGVLVSVTMPSGSAVPVDIKAPVTFGGAVCAVPCR